MDSRGRAEVDKGLVMAIHCWARTCTCIGTLIVLAACSSVHHGERRSTLEAVYAGTCGPHSRVYLCFSHDGRFYYWRRHHNFNSSAHGQYDRVGELIHLEPATSDHAWLGTLPLVLARRGNVVHLHRGGARRGERIDTDLWCELGRMDAKLAREEIDLLGFEELPPVAAQES